MNWKGSVTVGVAMLAVTLGVGGTAWFHARYDDGPIKVVPLQHFSNAEYPEDPEARSIEYGNYPHRAITIQQLGGTRFRFLIEPVSDHAVTIELPEVDLAPMVASVPPWVKSDPDLTRVGLIDREWNRQQVRFQRNSRYVRVHDGGDGFEQRMLTRVDLARNCLNAGLWELLLFTSEDREERVYEQAWFTFPLGLYKGLFEGVNGLSYWSYWWSLEHWVDPAGTPIRLDRLRTVDREWPLRVSARWDERPLARGEQRLKQKNVLVSPIYTYRDWYRQPVQFASFIPPGRYSVSHPQNTELHYLADLTGAVLRRIQMPAPTAQELFEIELAFRDSKDGTPTRLVLGGLDLTALPRLSPDRYEQGWEAPMGIGNPSFFESYEDFLADSPLGRPFYGFHLDAKDRWMNHHAVGVDGPLLHWDADDPSKLHLYLLAYERHALLNHFVISMPAENLSE